MVNDETHPLDDPLGTIHSAAWALEFAATHLESYSGEAVREFMQNLAKGLAIAHEQIQRYALREAENVDR
jgi:hypothetical protein